MENLNVLKWDQRTLSNRSRDQNNSNGRKIQISNFIFPPRTTLGRTKRETVVKWCAASQTQFEYFTNCIIFAALFLSLTLIAITVRSPFLTLILMYFSPIIVSILLIKNMTRKHRFLNHHYRRKVKLARDERGECFQSQRIDVKRVRRNFSPHSATSSSHSLSSEAFLFRLFITSSVNNDSHISLDVLNCFAMRFR